MIARSRLRTAPYGRLESNIMHIWTIENWTKHLAPIEERRTGLRLRFDRDVDPEVRAACKAFCGWLRSEYYFPLRVPVYVKRARRVRTMDGDLVCGSFFEPEEYTVEPYIRIASGDYPELLASRGRDDALASILSTISHELTHYFQWINALDLTDVGRERQATRYAKYILSEYAETRDHP